MIESISSYGYSLMAIAYLQHIHMIPSLQRLHSGPPIICKVLQPDLQRKGKKQLNTREVNVSFATNAIHLVVAPNLVWSSDGVPGVFYGFMKYFAEEYEYFPTTHVCIKQGGIIFNQDCMPKNRRARLVVRDPFEQERNCTSSVDDSLALIIKEFSRACTIIESGANFETIFQKISR